MKPESWAAQYPVCQYPREQPQKKAGELPQGAHFTQSIHPQLISKGNSNF